MNLKSRKSLSLTELIVASAMIGIVMLGMASVDFATRQVQITSSANSQVAMKVGAMMITISKYAALATGDMGTAGRPGCLAGNPVPNPCQNSCSGICIDPPPPPNNGVNCFRVDMNTPASTPTPNSCDLAFPLVSNDTPNNYSDDCWECFTQKTTGPNHNLYNCLRSTPDFCNGGLGDILVGTAQDFTVNYTYDSSAANLLNYVDIVITSYYDNTAAFDPFKNPSYTLSARITPAMSSLNFSP